MQAGQVLFMTQFLFWCGVAVAAPLLTIWAFYRSSKRRAVAVTALCLWCVLAGGALMGAMWSWMATENQHLQFRKIARMPEGAKPADVDLEPMKAIEFFVAFDRLGQHLGYMTVIAPLLAAAAIAKKALGERIVEKQEPRKPESELFTPYGP